MVVLWTELELEEVAIFLRQVLLVAKEEIKLVLEEERVLAGQHKRPENTVTRPQSGCGEDRLASV